MKTTTTLIAALALACGSAFAAGNTTDHATTPDQSAAVSSSAPDNTKGEGFVAKTKRAFHRMGEKLRSIGHKSETQQAKDRSNDTRTMGAGGSDTTKDSERKQRMDESYSGYQFKQKK